MPTSTAFLLDTSVLLWSGSSQGRLSSRARQALLDSDNDCWVSLVSVWELQIKHAGGKLPLNQNADQLAMRYAAAVKAEFLDMRIQHIAALYQLPAHHRDPFDRMLVAQALVEGLTIVSPDRQFKSYPVKVLW